MNSNCMKLEQEPPHFADFQSIDEIVLNLESILNGPKITLIE